MRKILLGLFVATIALSSCNDDRINEEAEFQPMDEFFNENKPAEQEFVITSDTGSAPIIGASRTELWGFRNILQYPNGDTVPFPYSLKLIELYTYKDMILYKMPTLSGTTVLESGGEIKITAWHDGTELVLKPNEKYPLVLATTPTIAGMNVFQGDHPNNEYGDWNLASDGSTIVVNTKYNMATGKMGWQNCAQSGTTSGETNITLSVEGKGGEFIELFLTMNDYHGVLTGNNLVIENAPLGQSATLLAMAKDQNGDFRLHKQQITITQNMEVTLDMKIVSESALLSTLAGL